MKAVRCARLLLALLLLSCSAVNRSAREAPPEPQAASAVPGRCRVGPDGGPAQADRGIGGTGVSADGEERLTDRGIGGTGIGGGPGGGTGVIGVITGFGSICVNGLEVAFDPGTPVQVDGSKTTTDALRAGQVTAIQAAGSGTDLQARTVSIRHEVSGPVEAVEQTGAVLIVAGQTVVIPASVWGKRDAREGDWVSVSGVRDFAGTIIASRIDSRASGRMLVHGTLRDEAGALRIGDLPLRLAPGVLLPAGRHVVASGRYEGGVLIADSVVADLLASNPAAYFGDAVDRLYVESYTEVSGGRVQVGPAWEAVSAPGLAGGGTAGLAVVEFARGRDGGLVAISLRDVAGAPAGARPSGLPWSPGPAGVPSPFGGGGFSPGSQPRPGFTPAPMPSPQTMGGGLRGYGGPEGAGSGRGFFPDAGAPGAPATHPPAGFSSPAGSSPPAGSSAPPAAR